MDAIINHLVPLAMAVAPPPNTHTHFFFLFETMESESLTHLASDEKLESQGAKTK